MTQRSSLNQSSIYAIAIVLQHLVSVVMLPIYTRYLTPEDYGTAELMSMGVDLISLLVGVISAEAIFRFYNEKEDKAYQKEVVFTVFSTSLLVNMIGLALIVSTREYSASYLFEGTSIGSGKGENLVLLYGATIVFQVMSAIPMAHIRIQQKPILFVAFSALRLILAVACNVYFVVYKELHIEGVVYAVFTFTLLHSAICSLYMLNITGFSFSAELAKRSISFSWPLMFSSMALYFTTYADRLFIKEYAGNDQLGLYALAYRFGFIMISFAWLPFSQYWEAQRYKVVKQENAVEEFQKTFRLTQMFVIFVALGISVFTQDLLRIMASPEFHEAYTLTGIIVFAYIFNIWSQFCLFGILYAQKTKYKAYIDWFIFPLTIVLYYITVPLYGAYGAAWSTFLSLGLRFILINHYSKRLYDMKIQWLRILLTLVVAISLYIISLILQFEVLPSILFNSFLMIIFLVYAYFGYGLTNEDRFGLRKLFHKFILKFARSKNA